VLGIKINLKKEISGIYSIPNESAHDWKKVLLDLKQKK
jgi:transposase-like protein